MSFWWLVSDAKTSKAQNVEQKNLTDISTEERNLFPLTPLKNQMLFLTATEISKKQRSLKSLKKKIPASS